MRYIGSLEIQDGTGDGSTQPPVASATRHPKANAHPTLSGPLGLEFLTVFGEQTFDLNHIAFELREMAFGIRYQSTIFCFPHHWAITCFY